MNTPLKLLVSMAFVLSPLAANAETVTYDFTGLVRSTYGMYSPIPIGTTITGTFTFDYAAADPTQSNGTVGSPSWTLNGGGGTYTGTNPVTMLLFTTTASVDFGNYSYSTPPVSSYYSYATVQGYSGTDYRGNFEANNLVIPAGASSLNYFSSTQIALDSIPHHFAYSRATGLPIFRGTGGANIQNDLNGLNNSLGYSIISMTPEVTKAPEIDPASAASGLTLLFGCVAVVRGSRKLNS
jgi:hypothetical protein